MLSQFAVQGEEAVVLQRDFQERKKMPSKDGTKESTHGEVWRSHVSSASEAGSYAENTVAFALRQNLKKIE